MTTASETCTITTPDGTTLRYTEAGAGDPAILFLHGWCCSRNDWRGQFPHFAANRRCLALDQRGHGESDKPDQDYTISGFVEDAAHLIRELGLDRPVVVGHSMGGVIALNLARAHPDLVRAIVMIDSPVVPLPETLTGTLEATLAGFQSPAYLDVAEGFIRAFMFNTDSPPDLATDVITGMKKAAQRLMLTAIADTLAPASMAAGTIPIPAFYIRAATSIWTQHELTERYPGLDVQTLGCAHFVQLEKPNETNQLIAAFIKDLA